MKILKFPDERDWEAIIRRPLQDLREIEGVVKPILQSVKVEGDKALIKYARQFDRVDLKTLMVPDEQLQNAGAELAPELIAAIELAIRNIEKFHSAQLSIEPKIQTSAGVWCWRENRAIEKVGLYIPGGTAPLFSTVIMLGVPAKLAGCAEVIICTPPNRSGTIHPAILFTAARLGIKKVYRIGGAQAIAAMAYGTESVPQVYKIFGPGNQYVTAAKMQVNSEGTAIDMPAGPSEVIVLADKTANPDFVSADLLSQAEHGADSQAMLVTDSENLTERVARAVKKQVNQLPRKEIVLRSLEHGKLILVKSMEQGMELINHYAPEHLIIITADPHRLAQKVINAGSVFLGAYSPESAGDYASGTNHVLATNGSARSFSGVSLDSFLKKITFQELSAEGLAAIGPAIEIMAEAEDLIAHKMAVSVRLNRQEAEKNED